MLADQIEQHLAANRQNVAVVHRYGAGGVSWSIKNGQFTKGLLGLQRCDSHHITTGAGLLNTDTPADDDKQPVSRIARAEDCGTAQILQFLTGAGQDLELFGGHGLKDRDGA